MLLKSILAVTCTLLCLTSLFFPFIAYATDNSFPSTFYITFQQQEGQVQPGGSVPQSLMSVQFLNGTFCVIENASFTFSMEETVKGEYIVKFMLSFEGFYDKISLPATVSNGRVYIDGAPTIFVTNPNDLIDGNTIQISQTEKYTLSGTVMRDSWAVSLIDNYELIAKWVQGTYQQTGSSDIPWSYNFFFDPKTGILLRPADNRFEDVLLNKLGVASISYGQFVLSDYSENLHQYFTLSDVPYPYHEHEQSDSFPFLGLILIPVFVVVFIFVVVFAYRASLKKKNKEKQKTFSNKPLKFNFTYGLR